LLESWQLQIEESGQGKCQELLLRMEDFFSLFIAAPESGAGNNFCCQLPKVSAEFHFQSSTSPLLLLDTSSSQSLINRWAQLTIIVVVIFIAGS